MRGRWLVLAGIIGAAGICPGQSVVPRTYLFQYAETPSTAAYQRAHGSVYRHEPWMTDEQWEAHYQRVLEGWPALLERIGTLRPDILYLAANGAFTLFGMTREDIPTVEQVRAQIEAQRAELAECRARGVEDVGFYQCAVSMRGNPDARHGIFALYDRWEEYAGVLNLGPKPPEDPGEWVQIRFDSGNPYIRAWDRPDAGGNTGYMCCPNNPYWRRYSQAVVQTGAQIGYANLFVDNPSMFCRCDWCRRGFADFLRRRFTPEEWGRLFPEIAWGEGSIEDERLAAERVRFWQESVGAHLAGLKEAMRRGNPGATITLAANGSRLTLGPWYTSRPNLAQFAAAGVDLGFKESPYEFSGINLRPVGNGLLAVEPGNIFDGYRIAHAASGGYYACPAQAYANLREHDRLFRLALSEALALDGCFLDGAPMGAELDSRGVMYDYVRAHRELFRTGESIARTAVILGDAEWYFDEDFFADAYRDTGAIRDWLDEHQVPFDYVLESALTLERIERYEAVILPGFKALMDATAELLTEYARRGGSLIVSGPAGTHHPAGPERKSPLSAGLPAGVAETDGLMIAEVGSGRVIACPRRFADADLPAGFTMTAYTISRPQTLGGKTRGPLLSVALEANRDLFLRALDAATELEPALVRGEPRPGLRVAGRQDLRAGTPWMAVHVINERMPMRFSDTGAHFDLLEEAGPHVYRDVPLVAPLPEGFRARSVQWAAIPSGGPAELRFEHVSGGLACGLPQVEMYSVLLVELEPGAPEASGRPAPRLPGAGLRGYLPGGEAPVPAPVEPPAATSGPPLRLNFTHPALLHAEAGADVRVSISAHGPASRWARWWIAGPDGEPLGTGAVECGRSAEASFTAATTGVYLLQGQAGAHDLSYASAPHGLSYPATGAQRLSFTGSSPELHFYVPEACETVPLMLQTRDRNGVFEIADANGNVLATRDGLGQAEIMDAGGAMVWSEKSSGAVYQRVEVPVPDGQAGRTWTLRFVAGAQESALRSNLYFADGFPGYLSAGGAAPLTIAD